MTIIFTLDEVRQILRDHVNRNVVRTDVDVNLNAPVRFIHVYREGGESEVDTYESIDRVEVDCSQPQPTEPLPCAIPHADPPALFSPKPEVLDDDPPF